LFPDRYERELRQEASQDVHFLGSLDHPNMPSLFHAADVVAVPSVTEPFGMVALEASASGLPVIASSTGGLPEVVEDERTGLLVSPGDATALARAIVRLARDGELRRRLGGAGRERALQFSWNRAAGLLEGIYARALQGRRLHGAEDTVQPRH
jgi:glycosyltransferase involved in cell wall biosynthesis